MTKFKKRKLGSMKDLHGAVKQKCLRKAIRVAKEEYKNLPENGIGSAIAIGVTNTYGVFYGEVEQQLKQDGVISKEWNRSF
jgi:hypothetical protein